MGECCSKCFKKRNPSISLDNIIQIKSTSGNLEQAQYNPNIQKNEVLVQNKEENYKISDSIIKEEVKDNNIESIFQSRVSSISFKINWDSYFDNYELSYYEKLYKNELYEDIEPKKKIIRFKKGELIGEGAFGKVYQGFDEDTGQIIAIKEINFRKINNKNLDRIKSFELEIDILSKLRHKNIIKYYGTNRNNDTLNIFLDYCIGGSIAKMLEVYGKFNENLIRKYTTQILEGLEYLHSHNIIHTGANILVDKEGVCKLSDFGGARRIVDEFDFKREYSFKGTPHWMAPEMIKNLKVSRFSDIWSVGCTVIEMATGEPPWSEYKTSLSALYKILNTDKPPEIPKFLSSQCKHFLNCCLKINPVERLNVYKLLRHPFITNEMFNYEQKSKENNHKITEEEVKGIESGFDNGVFETNKRNLTKTLFERQNEEEIKKVDEENTSRIYLNFNYTPNLTKKASTMNNKENKNMEKVELENKVCVSEKVEHNVKISTEGTIKKIYKNNNN